MSKFEMDFSNLGFQINLDDAQVQKDSIWNTIKIKEIGGPAEYKEYKAVQALLKDEQGRKALELYQARRGKLVDMISSDVVYDISKDLVAEENRQKKEVVLSKYRNDKSLATFSGELRKENIKKALKDRQDAAIKLKEFEAEKESTLTSTKEEVKPKLVKEKIKESLLKLLNNVFEK